MKKIAVIEDDKLLNQALVMALTKSGYQVKSGFTCQEGRRLIEENPDLIVMDISLPDGDGVSLCREAAEYGKIPVLFLTAKDEERDMLEAFEAGGDDYVVKPFQMSVLKKRIEAILRRSGSEENCFLYRGLEIDWDSKCVSVSGVSIKLTAKEYRLLELLARNKGQVLTKESILENVWDIDGQFVVENTVSVTVNRLRRKIEPDPANPVFVKNVFGLGYTFGD